MASPKKTKSKNEGSSSEPAAPKGPGKGAATRPSERYRLPREGGWANAWRVAGVLAAAGLAGSFLAWSNDPRRFAFSWLFAFMTTLAFGLGSLFLVIVQHLSGSGWSVTTRRVSEICAAGLPVFIVLFIPIAMSTEYLYPWVEVARNAEMHEAAGAAGEGEHDADADEGAAEEAGEEHSSRSGESLFGVSIAAAQDHEAEHGAEHGGAHGGEAHSPEHAAHHELIEAKVSFLNEPFFYVRAIGYLGLWSFLAYFFVSRSRSQDLSRDYHQTLTMQSASPLSMFGFALSLTFAAIDWMMSLEPAWYSTIYGVQYFAVCAVTGLATLVVLLHGLRSAGYLGEAVNVEHFHDVGKLLFGFLVFWMYISFSQFMLIWYAGIPEEATYYHARYTEGWQTYSWMLFVGHFLIPFFLLLSRNVKRNVPVLAFGAGVLLVMHVLEIYWLVMPYASEGSLDVQWMDAAALFGVFGTYAAVVFFMMTRVPLVPVGDPRLANGLHHEVV